MLVSRAAGRTGKLLFALLIAACSGRTSTEAPDASNGAVADGGDAVDAGSSPLDAGAFGGTDAGGDASAGIDASGDGSDCPGMIPIPSSVTYECEPTATASTGCPPFQANADAGLWYPFGCPVDLPEPWGACVGPCCGPQICTCTTTPLPGGAGFVCPD
jgi:hypothetical protein